MGISRCAGLPDGERKKLVSGRAPAARGCRIDGEKILFLGELPLRECAGLLVGGREKLDVVALEHCRVHDDLHNGPSELTALLAFAIASLDRSTSTLCDSAGFNRRGLSGDDYQLGPMLILAVKNISKDPTREGERERVCVCVCV